MDTYERQSLIDAIKVENFMKGDYVITEGDNGDKFYIVSEGTAIASKLIRLVELRRKLCNTGLVSTSESVLCSRTNPVPLTLWLPANFKSLS